MLRIFRISKDHPDMAIAEIKALAAPKSLEVIDDLIIIDTRIPNLHLRLAYTQEVCQLLFTCKDTELEETAQSFPWAKYYNGSFAVRFPGNRPKELPLAGFIFNKIPNVKVDLTHPKTLFVFFERNKTIYATVQEGLNPQNFEERKTHNRLAPHPSSMHPKLCRWFVNMTGIRKSGTAKSKSLSKSQKLVLTDPFCGSGGILIEASLLGFDVEGYDLDRIMVNRAKINLINVKTKTHLEVKDALTINKPMKYVAFDFPYGRATKAGPLIPLYEGFLKVLKTRLTGKAVIGYPDYIDLGSMARSLNLKIAEGPFDYYLHKSLTKKMIVVSR